MTWRAKRLPAQKKNFLSVGALIAYPLRARERARERDGRGGDPLPKTEIMLWTRRAATTATTTTTAITHKYPEKSGREQGKYGQKYNDKSEKQHKRQLDSNQRKKLSERGPCPQLEGG